MSEAAAPALGNRVTWEGILEAPAHGQHVAQLYTQPDFLVHGVSQFAGAGLRQGEATLLIATVSHRQALERRLEAEGFAIEALADRRQLIRLDAADALRDLLLDGMLDRERFQLVVGGAIQVARQEGYERVRVFSEMSELLRPRGLAAVLALETLWTELAAMHRLALLCGHGVDPFDSRSYRGILQDLSAAHSHLVPVEDYGRLARAVEVAYGEVFGGRDDAGFLRQTFVAHYSRPAAMPDAQAALLAACGFVPAAIGSLLDRTRHHYHRLARDRQFARAA